MCYKVCYCITKYVYIMSLNEDDKELNLMLAEADWSFMYIEAGQEVAQSGPLAGVAWSCQVSHQQRCQLWGEGT